MEYKVPWFGELEESLVVLDQWSRMNLFCISFAFVSSMVKCLTCHLVVANILPAPAQLSPSIVHQAPEVEKVHFPGQENQCSVSQLHRNIQLL